MPQAAPQVYGQGFVANFLAGMPRKKVMFSTNTLTMQIKNHASKTHSKVLYRHHCA